MKIKKIKMKNFRSFSNKETEVELDGKFNIFVGENGSGKTSVILALRYALFGTQGIDIKAEDLVNNINKDNMSVTLFCEKEGKEIIIKRGRSKKQSYVKLWIDGKESDLPSVKEYDKRIEEIIGFNYKMLDYFSINSQIFTKNFFKMKKAERDTFLKKAIGIEDFYNLIDRFKELRKKYEYEKESVEKETAVFKEILAEKKERLNVLKKSFIYQSKKHVKLKQKQFEEKKIKFQKEIDILSEKLKGEEKLKSLKAELKTLTESVKKEKSELKEHENIGKSNLNDIIKEIENVKETLESIRESEDKKNLLRTAKQKFYQHILSLNAKKKNAINNFNKVTAAAEAIRTKGTYLNRITNGELESFIDKYGEGILKFLFIADKKFYFEKEKVFTNAKIELSNSQRIINEYKEFKDSLFNALFFSNNSVLKKIEEEKRELILKYKNFIKPLIKTLRESKKMIKKKDYYQKKLEKLFSQKAEIERKIKIADRVCKQEKRIELLKTEIEKLFSYEGAFMQYSKKSALLAEINEELLNIKTELRKHEEYESVLKEEKKYQKKIEENEKVFKELDVKVKKCDEIIKRDAKLAIEKATEDFLKIFNYYIQKYTEELNVRFYIKIKNDFSFLLKERGKPVDYSILSKGEETILNLLIIFALNETLRTISNINFNLLILDEIDGTLDEKNLFKIIKKIEGLKKDIIFVSHRKEIFEMEENLERAVIYKVKKELFTKLEKKQRE